MLSNFKGKLHPNEITAEEKRGRSQVWWYTWQSQHLGNEGGRIRCSRTTILNPDLRKIKRKRKRKEGE